MENIIENGAVYRVYSQNGIEIKEFERMEKSIELTYDGSSIHIAALSPETYSGPANLIVNGSESVVQVSGGITDVTHAASSYDVIQAKIEGYADGRLVLGAPPVPMDRVDQLAADNVALKQQNEEINAQIIDLFEQLIVKGVL